MSVPPGTPHRGELGLLQRHPYQLGYVTSDLDAAMEGYGRALGGWEFVVSERVLDARVGGSRATLRVRFGLGFVGESMVELIEPISDETGFYGDLLPDAGFGISLHHLGYLIDPHAEWSAFRAAVDPDRIAFELSGDPSVVYLDTRAELGHYVEYLHFSSGTLEKWQARVPRNDGGTRA